jgi:cytochrome c551/c552
MTEQDVAVGDRAPRAEKLLFARGALLGLISGALIALVLIAVAGAITSFIGDGSGSRAPVSANAEPAEAGSPIARGKDLANRDGCVACHSTNGVDMTGPSWKGVAETRTAEYVRQSIVDPNADIVAGFSPNVMPRNFGDKLSPDDLDALVAYIMSL